MELIIASLYNFHSFLLILLLVLMDHLKQHNSPYYTSVVPRDSSTINQLKEYNQMLERLNR